MTRQVRETFFENETKNFFCVSYEGRAIIAKYSTLHLFLILCEALAIWNEKSLPVCDV